ncbi:hypothetical protein M0R45_015842 [Rubus argutus]|uniref:Uncharacterized protein n=1 Tax=Rubus argutus TaxID=59490 RepID=A0AAW1XT93_RUBAR
MKKQRGQRMIKRSEEEIELGKPSKPRRLNSVGWTGYHQVRLLYLIASMAHKRPRFPVQLHLSAFQPHPVFSPNG